MVPTLRNFRLGLLFSSIAVLSWGVLPIALKLAANFTDAITLTWVRFVVALVVTLSIQLAMGGLAGFKQLRAGDWLKLVLAGLLLMVNYITFVWCLDHIHPVSAQLNFQVAPFFLAFGGVLFQGDRIKLGQWLCFATLALGMLLFFHPYLDPRQGGSGTDVFKGVALVQLSAMAWSIYALLQKTLISKVAPQKVLLSIYALGVIVMAPAIELGTLQGIGIENWLVIAFCSVNTLVAYGAFAQAMKHWQTVQVSAMVALTPIASFAASALCVAMFWWPDTIKNIKLDGLSLLGMLIVLLSAILVQLLSKPVARSTESEDIELDGAEKVH